MNAALPGRCQGAGGQPREEEAGAVRIEEEADEMEERQRLVSGPPTLEVCGRTAG